MSYFDQLEQVRYEGPTSNNPLAFHHYNPDELVLGKRMAEHLRFAACYWHTFCWNGADMNWPRPTIRRAKPKRPWIA